MQENFIQGIIAIARDLKLFFLSLLVNKLFMGFLVGIVMTVLLVGFLLSKNPRHIPMILRYSSAESFQRISERNSNGTFDKSFSQFGKIYSQIRALFLIAFTSFCLMIVVIAFKQS